MGVARMNLKQTSSPAERRESWEEHYGRFTVFVERHTTERHWNGRRIPKTVEYAHVCWACSGDILYKADPGDKATRSVRATTGFGLTPARPPREEVLAWLFAEYPETQDIEQATAAAQRQAQAAQRAGYVARVREIGVFPFLAEEGVGYVSTPDLAKMMGITPSQLGSFLRTAGLAVRDGKRWTATNPALAHRENGSYVSWNPVGAEAVWVAAYAHGVTMEPPHALLSLLRKRFPYLQEWAAIDEITAGSSRPPAGEGPSPG